MSNREQVQNSYLGRYYEVKNRLEEAHQEKLQLKHDIEIRQLVIEEYQRHYAAHTFTKKIERINV